MNITTRIAGVGLAFGVMTGRMIALAAAAEDARNRVEAMSAPLPRSSPLVDAMHWTPPADGEAVPPCIA